jgi:predicted DNA-binding transcriptional regulator AlpA
MQGDEEHAGAIPAASGGEQSGEGTALVDATEAARMCKASVSMFYKMTRAGKTPRPIKFGKLMRWRWRDLSEWIDAGCPELKKEGE